MSIFLMFLRILTVGARLGSDPDGLAFIPPETSADTDARLGSDPNG